MVGARKPKINEVLGVSRDYKVVKFGRQGDCDAAYLRRDVRERTCCICGGHAHIEGRRWRKVWHTPARNLLMVVVARMQCAKCKKSWNERHEMVGTASIHMSVDVQDAILVDLMDKKSVKATSEKNDPTPHMVNCVLDQAVLDASYLPETLCIDEFKANTDEGEMAISVADGATGYLVETLPRLTGKCLNSFFGGFSAKVRSHVRFYCCDMSPMFIRAKKEWFPTAILCIDRFHVVKLINEAFNDVRKRVQKDEGLPVSSQRDQRCLEALPDATRARAYRLRLRGAPGNKQSHPRVHARPHRRRDSRSCPFQTSRSTHGPGEMSA